MAGSPIVLNAAGEPIEATPVYIVGGYASVVSPSTYGGSSTTDSYDALVAAAAVAVATGDTLFIDRKYPFGQTWTPPAGLVMRGRFADSEALTYTGSGDVGIRITAAIDIDGVVVDEAHTGSRAVATNGTLVAIGNMDAGATYLPGVRIGRLRARRTRKAGIVMANLDEPVIDTLSVQDVYNHGVMLMGLRRAKLARLIAVNIGDLQKNGSRRGTAIMHAADPKNFGAWYVPANVLPTFDFQGGSALITATTDSSFYFQNDMGRGCSGLQWDSVNILLSGKDGVKIRSGAKDIKIGSVNVRKIANNAFISNGQNAYAGTIDRISEISIGSLHANQVGYDAISEITGVAYGTTYYVDDQTAGTSINDTPCGIDIENTDGITIGVFHVGVVQQIPNTASPALSGKGHGLSVVDSTGVRAQGRAYLTQGRAVDIRTSADYLVDVQERDCCNPTVGGYTTLTPVTDCVAFLQGSTGKLDLRTVQPTKRLTYPIVINGGFCEFTVNDARASYNLDGSSFYVRTTNGGDGRYLNAPATDFYGSVTFDASGLSGSISHGVPGSVPPHIWGADSGGATINYIKVNAVLAGSAGGTFVLSDRSGGNSAITGARNIAWRAMAVKAANGWG